MKGKRTGTAGGTGSKGKKCRRIMPSSHLDAAVLAQESMDWTLHKGIAAAATTTIDNGEFRAKHRRPIYAQNTVCQIGQATDTTGPSRLTSRR